MVQINASLPSWVLSFMATKFNLITWSKEAATYLAVLSFSCLPSSQHHRRHTELIYDSLHPSTSAYMRHLRSRLRPLFMWRTQNGLCGYVSDRSFLALTANIVCSPLISICSLIWTEEVSSIIFSNAVQRTQTLKDTQTSYVVWSEK